MIWCVYTFPMKPHPLVSFWIVAFMFFIGVFGIKLPLHLQTLHAMFVMQKQPVFPMSTRWHCGNTEQGSPL